MLYIYAPVLSNDVLELARAVDGRRLKKFDGMHFWKGGKRLALSSGDIVICWGKPLPDMEGIRILNGGSPSKKHQDYSAWTNYELNTFQARTTFYPNYLPRMYRSVNGNDLLHPSSGTADYYVSKLTMVEEYVIHSFAGRSIRSGKKVPKPGLTVARNVETWEGNQGQYAHPWIRTDLGGWRVEYDGYKSTLDQRKYASLAVKILDLTFGAVTLGTRDDGRMFVVGIDRAPVLEGVTLNSYVRAIQRWIKNEKPETDDEVVEAEVPQAPVLHAEQGWAVQAFNEGLPVMVPPAQPQQVDYIAYDGPWPPAPEAPVDPAPPGWMPRQARVRVANVNNPHVVRRNMPEQDPLQYQIEREQRALRQAQDRAIFRRNIINVDGGVE